MVPAALNFGVTPVEVKEIVYQAAAYLGIGRVFPFLKAVNEILTDPGASPFRFRPRHRPPWRPDLRQGNRPWWILWENPCGDLPSPALRKAVISTNGLADNCFGDYYTRSGLGYRMREMITFCFLAAQGGCEHRS